MWLVFRLSGEGPTSWRALLNRSDMDNCPGGIQSTGGWSDRRRCDRVEYPLPKAVSGTSAAAPTGSPTTRGGTSKLCSLSPGDGSMIDGAVEAIDSATGTLCAGSWDARQPGSGPQHDQDGVTGKGSSLKLSSRV